MGVTLGAIVGITGTSRDGTGAGCGGGGGAIFATGVTVTVADLRPLSACLFADGADGTERAGAAEAAFAVTTAFFVAPLFFEEELLVFTFAPTARTAGAACARFPDGRRFAIV
jgi:hypothetical protein